MNQKSYYNDVARVYADMRAAGVTNVEKLGWTNAEIQQQNFTLITDMIKDVHAPLPGLRLHDAGCGTGDLLAFLQRTEQEPREYVGTDFTKESIDIAKERFPSKVFIHCDLLPRGYKPGICPQADVTVAVGSLAFHKPRDVEALLNRLWERTTAVLAFNTWWQLDERYIYHQHIEQLRKCINRFLRNKQVHRKLGDEYDQPTEALFIVYR
jgi:SAM-dependent methyltransferase